MAKIQEKLKEFKKMKKDELLRLLSEKQEKLRQMRFDLVSGKVKNIREIRETRKDIARMKTISSTNI